MRSLSKPGREAKKGPCYDGDVVAARIVASVKKTLRAVALGGALAAIGCHPGTPASPEVPRQARDPLERVAVIHGGTGPWVVAGYRMGRYALSRLGLPPQSFDLEVIHHTPAEVQYSCIADGAAAATGASVGKLNLRLVDASEAAVATTYRRKSTGQSVILRPTAAFADRFRDVPRDQLADAGRAVLSLPDSAIFEEVATPSP